MIFASHLYTFVDPLPGLPDNHRFALIEEERYAPLRWMQSLDDPLICLPLLPAALLEFDTEKYRARITAADEGSGDDLGQGGSVYLVTRQLQDGGKLVVNLMAPIYLDPGNGTGRQVILQDPSYSLRQGIVWNARSRKFGLVCSS